MALFYLTKKNCSDRILQLMFAWRLKRTFNIEKNIMAKEVGDRYNLFFVALLKMMLIMVLSTILNIFKF